ncbi:MAG: Hpt domain-containing protein [Candidatus Omnitrophota bacterium]
MDVKQYKDLFISEGREILSSLNTSLVSLEKNPQDTNCLNEIFRQAHTLKGMAASMRNFFSIFSAKCEGVVYNFQPSA